jgi:hypothetical protein
LMIVAVAFDNQMTSELDRPPSTGQNTSREARLCVAERQRRLSVA